MHNLPVNQSWVDFTRAADEIRDFITFIIQQAELAGAQTYGRVNHLFSWPGHQIEQHQLVFITLRHIVDNLAHIKTRQVVGHVLGQLKPGDNLTMHFVTAATADTVVGVVLQDLFPHFLQQAVVIFKAQRPGERCQRFENIDDFVLNTGMGNFDVHPRGADRPVHAHVFPVDKLPFQRCQFTAVSIDMFKDLLEAAHHKFTLRIDFTELIHHRKNVLL